MTDGFLTFPEGPRSRLDEALGDLVVRASDVLATQGRLRALLRANQLISQQLDLPIVLRRIVETAIELVDAQYGALGVIAADGTLEQFIHVGMTENEVAGIAHLPEGHGLLGALIRDPRPIRLPHLGDDQRSSGFPAHHPAMESFLGVPIRVGDRLFGNLYLTNAASGEFSADDEELVTSLATTAGFAIENARLFESAQRRQAWLAASAELTVAAGTVDDPLGVVVERVREVSQADVVRVILPSDDPEYGEIARAKGGDAPSTIGLRVPRRGTAAGRVLHSGKPVLMPEERPTEGDQISALGPTMAVPISADGTARGVLTISRLPGGAPFAQSDLDMVADLAARVGIAVELAAARSDREKIALMEDRSRIARDLHDHVIQQLFATGLELHSIVGALPPGSQADRLDRAITHIDESIGQIRTAIFALSPKSPHGDTAIRHRIIDLVGEIADCLPQKPWVSFEGPVDLVIAGDRADDALAVVREALTNIARHAEPSRVSIVVAVRNSRVEIDVQNDGAEAQSARRSGLSNLQQRAARRGGDALFESVDGTARLHWWIPIGAEADA